MGVSMLNPTSRQGRLPRQPATLLNYAEPKAGPLCIVLGVFVLFWEHRSPSPTQPDVSLLRTEAADPPSIKKTCYRTLEDLRHFRATACSWKAGQRQHPLRENTARTQRQLIRCRHHSHRSPTQVNVKVKRQGNPNLQPLLHLSPFGNRLLERPLRLGHAAPEPPRLQRRYLSFRRLPQALRLVLRRG